MCNAEQKVLTHLLESQLRPKDPNIKVSLPQMGLLSLSYQDSESFYYLSQTTTTQLPFHGSPGLAHLKSHLLGSTPFKITVPTLDQNIDLLNGSDS